MIAKTRTNSTSIDGATKVGCLSFVFFVTVGISHVVVMAERASGTSEGTAVSSKMNSGGYDTFELSQNRMCCA